MHFPAIARVTGASLALFSAVMVLPAGIAALYGEPALESFALTFAVTLLAGLVLITLGRGRR